MPKPGLLPERIPVQDYHTYLLITFTLKYNLFIVFHATRHLHIEQLLFFDRFLAAASVASILCGKHFAYIERVDYRLWQKTIKLI